MASIKSDYGPSSDKTGSFCTRFCASFDRNLKSLVKRPTTENILYWYTPAVGGLSYTAFSLHIFKPHFLSSIFPHCKYTVANCLLFNAHLGCGLYLYNSRHLSATSRYFRIMYSVYGTLIFNFGSILLWAVTKSILPEEGLAKIIFSLSSSICMLLIGKEYISYVDGWCSKSKTEQ